MNPTQRARRLLPALLLTAALTACGGDAPADETSEAAATTDVATPATEEAAPDQASAPTPRGAEGGGEVTVGDTTWSFVPTIQCMITSDGQYAILAGEAADDPGVEIGLDIGPEDQRFDVTVDGEGMFARGDALTATVDGSTVSGTATLSAGPDTREATFTMTCA